MLTEKERKKEKQLNAIILNDVCQNITNTIERQSKIPKTEIMSTIVMRVIQNDFRVVANLSLLYAQKL